MADEIDIANEQADRWLRQSLAQTLAQGARLAPKGSCYYCDADFTASDPESAKRLFCDLDCSKAHEEEQRLKNRR